MTTEESRPTCKFTEPWDLGDVSFTVEGRRIYANKGTMSMWSPVFKVMFGGAFRESEAEPVPLPGKLYDEILELICVLHPPSKPMDVGNVEVLLPLAQEYQIDGLTKLCEAFLLHQEPSVRYLVLAEKFSLMTLEKKCLDYANRSSLKTLRQQQEFKDLPDKICKDLLLEKASRYEKALDEVRALVTGRATSGLCSNGPHWIGGDRNCLCGTVYEINHIVESVTGSTSY